MESRAAMLPAASFDSSSTSSSGMLHYATVPFDRKPASLQQIRPSTTLHATSFPAYSPSMIPGYSPVYAYQIIPASIGVPSEPSAADLAVKKGPYHLQCSSPSSYSSSSAQPSIISISTPPLSVHNSQQHQPQSKDSIRRTNHSLIEKRRREKINDKISVLKNLVPKWKHGEDAPLHKLTILQSAIEYILELEAKNRYLVAQCGMLSSHQAERTERDSDGESSECNKSENGLDLMAKAVAFAESQNQSMETLFQGDEEPSGTVAPVPFLANAAADVKSVSVQSLLCCE